MNLNDRDIDSLNDNQKDDKEKNGNEKKFSRPKDSVKIIEVGPRDGLQNESKILDLDQKLNFVLDLVDSGLKSIEVTSFVRADRVPQMADSEKIYQKVVEKINDQSVRFPCLVPNAKGMENALKAGVKEIALFTATSEEFNKKNINATIEQSIKNIEQVAEMATNSNVQIRGYISTVFGCPYEGDTSLDMLFKLSEKLLALGVYEISLGDTI